jgi:NTE family protein
MRQLLLLAAAAAVLLLPCRPATAAPADAKSPPAPGRARIGLVLGGGGAMGAAHIGVIKVLEELHVPVDCIAGTSMGALVGGAYASGMDAAALQRFFTSIDWQTVFGLEQVRRYQPMYVKRENETVSNKLEFGVGDQGLIAPRALLETQQVESLIRNMVSSQSAVRDFDRLPIPFRAIATDLKSGRMVVFSSGELPVALRASMSVPGVFAPVELGDRLLVDGGITRNLPVDVARDTCADIVIAVAVHPAEPSEDSMRSATGSLRRMVDILINSNEQASLDSLGPEDVGLKIVVDGVGSADFQLAATAIEQGERAARTVAGRLQGLRLSDEAYDAWRAGHEASVKAGPRVVAATRFEGVDERTAAYLQTLIRSAAGEPFNESQVADDALRIYATGAYESVAHRVEGPPAASVVVFTPVSKSWGPAFLAFDFGLEAGLSGEPEVLGSVLLRRTWPDAIGKEWRVVAQLGGESHVETDLRLPLSRERRVFLLPRIGWYSSSEDFYDEDRRVANYDFRSARGELRAGLDMGTWGELQAGLYRRNDATVRTLGAAVVPGGRSYHDAGYLLEFERDTRDSDLWSTRGSRQRLELLVSETALGAGTSYQTALFETNQSAVFGSSALVFLDLAGGTAFGSRPPIQQMFRLGGPGNMTGLQRGQLRGEDFVYSRLGLGWRLIDVGSLLNMDLFAGAAVETGNTWRRPDGSSDSGLRFGGQIFVGGNTPFGPVQLTGGYVDGGDYAVFLSIGRPTRALWR